MFSYWAYILIGNDKTGKSTFQRKLVNYLCDRNLSKLNRNTTHTIKRTTSPSSFSTLFTMNRSFQEVKEYGTVENYFKFHFSAADVCILSSHLELEVVEQMIYQLHKRYYNVGGIFWKNSSNRYSSKISADLNWDERIWFDNPKTSNIKKREKQLTSISLEFSNYLLKRSFINS